MEWVGSTSNTHTDAETVPWQWFSANQCPLIVCHGTECIGREEMINATVRRCTHCQNARHDNHSRRLGLQPCRSDANPARDYVLLAVDTPITAPPPELDAIHEYK